MKTIVKKEFASWFVILSVIFTIYLTGLQTEVLGRVQQMVLATGLIKPELKNDVASDSNAAYVISQAEAGHDFPLLTLDGKSANLKEFKGKVIFINLWATWCPPCIAEMPNIHKLYERTSTEDVAFVMLSLDEDFEKARKFVKRKEYTFPVYGVKESLPIEFETTIIPTTYVIDRNGKIVLRKEGMAKYDTDEFRTFLDKLIKSKAQ
ncbi:TlpA family protein disulfide reductase [Rhodocytophaga rosea]|uniref:TlpA family protein disulfide reductase n=1 Tax=Rhodocytophaga rosea TaxID=2704465 RepID=A0A6C0GQR0_9BACT|nr:TlpA disulfide reductase family protein [Rhodocytophaga rosea]QHT70194.1 TlpA family protein disulfide reductase [Rhodocytophaga rosea]